MMKLYTAFAVLLAISLVSAEDSGIKLNPNYIHGVHKFSGKVETRMGSFTQVHEFSGSTTKDTFDLNWSYEISGIKVSGSVSVGPAGNISKMNGISDQKYDDAFMAIASATGVSGGCAHLMYSIWNGDTKIIIPDIDVIRTMDNGLIVVSGYIGSRARKQTLYIKDDEILRTVSEYSPAMDTKRDDHSKLTDDEIKLILKAMNKEQTDNDVASFRELMKSTDEKMKTVKDVSICTTTIRWMD